jgi:DNA-binding transcriptional regulator LsrR (DeoR family)
MAASSEQHRLLYRIAQAYYVDRLTQQQIAKRFGISRPKVSRLLHKARDEKIVNITLVPPPSGLADLERELERRYGLEEAVIVSVNDPQDLIAVARELGPAAAECLVRRLQGDEVLTLSWGTTLLAIVDSLPAKNWPEMRVVQMLGGLGRPEAETHGTDLARRMAEAFGTRPRLMPAPGIVASKLVRDALVADPQISDTLSLAAKANLALVGIGVPVPGSVVMQASTILTDEDLDQLQAQGAVGDISLRFIDADGRPVEHEISDRVIGLELEQIMEIPLVIGVAGGVGKFKVIRAALRGRIVNVLVTDPATARALLDEAD